MEASEADYHHTFEDIAGVAGAQLLAAVVMAVAVALYGSAFVGVVVEFDRPLGIPYSSLGAYVTAAIALSMSVTIPGRYRHLWIDPKARGAVMIGLGQMFGTAIVIAVAGYVLAGCRVDLFTPGRRVVTWLDYGVTAAGLVQAVVAAAAFGFLLLKRDLPDVVD